MDAFKGKLSEITTTIWTLPCNRRNIGALHIVRPDHVSSVNEMFLGLHLTMSWVCNPIWIKNGETVTETNVFILIKFTGVKLENWLYYLKVV